MMDCVSKCITCGNESAWIEDTYCSLECKSSYYIVFYEGQEDGKNGKLPSDKYPYSSAYYKGYEGGLAHFTQGLLGEALDVLTDFVIEAKKLDERWDDIVKRAEAVLNKTAT